MSLSKVIFVVVTKTKLLERQNTAKWDDNYSQITCGMLMIRKIL